MLRMLIIETSEFKIDPQVFPSFDIINKTILNQMKKGIFFLFHQSVKK